MPSAVHTYLIRYTTSTPTQYVWSRRRRKHPPRTGTKQKSCRGPSLTISQTHFHQIAYDASLPPLSTLLTPTQDPEAQHTSTSTPSPNPTPSSSTPQLYAHTGRGGAGNWYQPSQLAKDGTFSTPSDATALPTTAKPNVSTPWHPEGQQLPVGRAGRGGAGNFVWGDEGAERERVEEEERRKGEVREGVEREVESG